MYSLTSFLVLMFLSSILVGGRLEGKVGRERKRERNISKEKYFQSNKIQKYKKCKDIYYIIRQSLNCFFEFSILQSTIA